MSIMLNVNTNGTLFHYVTGSHIPKHATVAKEKKSSK